MNKARTAPVYELPPDDFKELEDVVQVEQLDTQDKCELIMIEADVTAQIRSDRERMENVYIS